MGSKGSATTTTAPNPTAMSAYNDILARAQGVAGTPYTPYNGELVAGVNPQQSTGIANINANWNSAQPYLQTAAGYATDAATPLTTEQIQQYMSPYTQDVVRATQAQFANQNEQQRQGVIGNSISRGSFGGNREAVAEAELANQQQLAQAPVISGLYNQAYTTGLNTALTEQQARAQGAYSLGNLGVSGQNAALTGANAQIGAGTLQQGTQQALDAARYQQFVNQQAYPFQTAQWLAGIGTGVGSQMGGTSTAPAPSLFGQLAGLGTAGVGVLGGTGAFGSAGWLAPAVAALADGGAVGRASGGVAPGPTTLPETPETLKLQQRQLLSGHRRAQMFPRGTPELPLPRGMNRLEHENGVFHYDPRRVDGRDIHRLSTAGRENDILDLGPYSKDDVLKRLHGGEVPVAVVERHPDGTEARAAIGTHTTADRQMAAMNRTKSPGHIVRIEDPRETIEHRLRGGRVHGFAGGGAPMEQPAAAPTNGVGSVLAGLPYGGGSGWVPKADIARGAGAPRSAGVAPPPSLAQQAKEIGSLANIINGGKGGSTSPGNYGGSPETNPNLTPYAGQDEGETLYRGGVAGRASGGVANLPFHRMVPHLAEGGSPYDAEYFDAPMPAPPQMPSELNATGPASWGSGKLIEVPTDYSSIAPGTFDSHRRRPEGIAPVYDDLPPEITGGASRPASGRIALGYADENGDGGGGELALGQDGGGGPGVQGVAPAINFGSDSKLWPSLMSAGFGMMASKSPFAGVAIGEGGQAGMQAYSSERQREDRINSEVKKLAQEAEFAQKRLDLATRSHTEQSADQLARSTEAREQHDRPYREQTADQRARAEEARLQHEDIREYRQGTLDRSKYTYQQGEGIDPETGNKVPGMYRLPTQTTGGEEPKFFPGQNLSGRGNDAAKPGATEVLARSLMRARDEQRKEDPNVPALSFEEAVNLAHRAPNADQATVRRLNMAQSAWKAWLSNPINMSKKDAPENSLEFWEKRYGVTGAGPAPQPQGQGSPTGAPPAITLRPVDQQALDWANANPADPRAAEIKRRLGVK